MAEPNPLEILRLLAARRIDFIVVGMAAGVLRGAPTTTLDLDIVHRRSTENVSRLLVETLIELKEKAGRPKDLAALPVLRATLSESLRRED